jgi:hypothetical protein
MAKRSADEVHLEAPETRIEELDMPDHLIGECKYCGDSFCSDCVAPCAACGETVCPQCADRGWTVCPKCSDRGYGCSRDSIEGERARALARVKDLEKALVLALKHKNRYHEALADLTVYVACMGCCEVWHEDAIGGWNEPFRCDRCDEHWCQDCKPRGCDCAESGVSD